MLIGLIDPGASRNQVFLFMLPFQTTKNVVILPSTPCNKSHLLSDEFENENFKHSKNTYKLKFKIMT